MATLACVALNSANTTRNSTFGELPHASRKIYLFCSMRIDSDRPGILTEFASIFKATERHTRTI